MSLTIAGCNKNSQLVSVMHCIAEDVLTVCHLCSVTSTDAGSIYMQSQILDIFSVSKTLIY